MPSNRKIGANRENAKRSTGPRTAAGKARSSQNARTHGVFAMKTLDGPLLARTRASLFEDLRPQGFLEELLVDRMASIYVRWRRVLEYLEAVAQRRMSGAVHSEWSAQLEDHKRRAESWASVGVALEPLEPLDDVRFHLSCRKEEMKALSNDDPIAHPTNALFTIVIRAGERLGMDTAYLGSVLDEEDLRRGAMLVEFTARFTEFVTKMAVRSDSSVSSLWERLRVELREDIRTLGAEVRRRKREEREVRLLASLPGPAEVDRITRYEAHLARQFDRTLQQFKERRMIKQGIDSGP